MGKERLTVLVVDDQEINRQILHAILRAEYNVLEAENGARALEQLAHAQGVAAILLDLIMPVMDGYTFLEKLGSTAYASLPVIAVTGDKNDNTEQRALELGAWDFVSKPYHPATLLTRLKNVIVRSQYYLLKEMKRAYEHDPLTGLYNRTAFFTETRRLLDEHAALHFALVRFDIDHFQTFNSFWGEEEGDRLLLYIADRLREIAQRHTPCVYARINADTFCICMPYDDAAIRTGTQHLYQELAEYNREYRLVPSFGVYVIASPDEKIQKMYELATLAAGACKGSYLQYLSYYSPDMSTRVLQDQWIVNEMQKALDAEQFEVYIQPKYNLGTGLPCGGEALVRWRHPDKGLLPPGRFIPVFEQNGFIGKVDYYMWERVCRLLRKWRADGRRPAPISVNVSRVNMYNPNLVALLTGLVKSYDIPPRLLQLELTESAYMENPEIMEKAVSALHDAGFAILMDDFGSGYSSLNTLKDIHVDILKIDMKFLSGNSDAARSRSILASAVRMAGWLSTPVVMEGVETAEQVGFLKSIGCEYAQGYYYARPMPVADYERLALDAHQMPARESSESSENLADITRVLWGADAREELLFNSMDAPAAVYERENGALRLLRANDSFGRAFAGWRGIENDFSGLANAALRGVHAAFEAAAQTRGTTDCRFWLSAEDGAQMPVRMTLKYWGMNGTSQIVFAQFCPEAQRA